MALTSNKKDLAATVKLLLAGESLVCSNAGMAKLEKSEIWHRLRSIPNPNPMGTKDLWLASLAPRTLQILLERIQDGREVVCSFEEMAAVETLLRQTGSQLSLQIANQRGIGDADACKIWLNLNENNPYPYSESDAKMIVDKLSGLTAKDLRMVYREILVEAESRDEKVDLNVQGHSLP